MSLLDGLFRDDETNTPEIIDKKTYELCSEDNPNERVYCCGRKKDAEAPACKLSLTLNGITWAEAKKIDSEIRLMLEQHGFTVR